MIQVRHKSREVALQFLYQLDILKKEFTSIEELKLAITYHFEHFKIPSKIQPFAKELILGALAGQSENDELIKKNLRHWKMERLSSIDRCILRIGVFELKQTKTESKIILDEAIGLGKQYSNDQSISFIHGILGAINPKQETLNS